MIVMADASVFIAVAMNEPEKAWVIAATREASAVAPHSLPFEIANAFSRLVRRRLLTTEGAEAAWQITQRMPVSLREIDIEAALRLSCARNIYAYDGLMLQCAIESSAAILTLDLKMRAMAKALHLPVLE